MQKKKRRWCAWLLTAAMILSMLPMQAFAETEEATVTEQESQDVIPAADEETEAEPEENMAAPAENTETEEAETEKPADTAEDTQPVEAEATEEVTDSVETEETAELKEETEVAPEETESTEAEPQDQQDTLTEVETYEAEDEAVPLAEEVPYDADFTNIPAKATSFGKYSTMLNWSSGLPETDKLYKAGEGTISWDAQNKKLTLDRATVKIELNGNGAIQLPAGSDVTVELVGENVFEETGSNGGVTQSQGFFNTFSNLTFTGEGSLSMEGSSKGIYVNTGASVVFDQKGTVNIAARNCGIQQEGNITVNSGELLVSASMTGGNVRGIGMNLSYSNEAKTFELNDGYVEIHADHADGNSSGALYAVYSKNTNIAIHGGKLLVTAAADGISAANITIDGDANVTTKSQNSTALTNSIISGNAVVNAETVNGNYAASVQEIHGNAKITGSGHMGGVSIDVNTFQRTENAVIISRGETAQYGPMSRALQSAVRNNKLDGCKISVDTDKSGENETVWDWDLTNHPLNTSTYKYVKIERCTHENAVDDGDCTTPVVCPDCGRKTTLFDGKTHNYATEWTDEENGVHSLFCANKLYNGEQCEKKITVSAPDVTVVYDGNQHGISVTAPDGAVVIYKNGDTYTSENPTYVEIGTYTVEYQVTGLGTILEGNGDHPASDCRTGSYGRNTGRQHRSDRCRKKAFQYPDTCPGRIYLWRMVLGCGDKERI